MTSRYEREIEELLKRMDGRPRSVPLSVRLHRALGPIPGFFTRAWRGYLRRTLIEQFIIAAALLAAVAWAISGSVPTLSFYAGLVSVALFVAAIVISVTGHWGLAPAEQERRLRTQTAERGPSLSDLWLRLRRWWWRQWGRL